MQLSHPITVCDIKKDEIDLIQLFHHQKGTKI